MGKTDRKTFRKNGSKNGLYILFLLLRNMEIKTRKVPLRERKFRIVVGEFCIFLSEPPMIQIFAIFMGSILYSAAAIIPENHYLFKIILAISNILLVELYEIVLKMLFYFLARMCIVQDIERTLKYRIRNKFLRILWNILQDVVILIISEFWMIGWLRSL